MRRRLFTLCSAASLVLCVAVCVLWVRSYWVADAVRSYRTDVAAARRATDTVRSVKGRVALSSTRVLYTSPERAQRARAIIEQSDGVSYAASEPHWYTPRRAPTVWERLGFGRVPDPGARSHFEARRRQSQVYVPHWFLALVTAVPPALWVRSRYVRRRRRGRGLCPACGYDLRATPGRCPECGMEASPA